VPHSSRIQGFVATSWLALGCGSTLEEPAKTALEVNVIVTSDWIGVHAHVPGSCREVTELPGTSTCETFGWALVGVESASVTDLCVPEPTCVTEIRLEREGQVVGTSQASSVGFNTTLDGDDAQVVLSGCGEPIVVELPRPLDGDIAFDAMVVRDATERVSGIRVEATGDSVVSVAGYAASQLLHAKGFESSCRSESGPVELPVSDEYDTYVVTELALGEPTTLRNGSVHVFRGRRQHQVVSKTVPLGPVWDATLELAKQSPLYAGCESYCSAWQTGCQVEVDLNQCAVECVAIGSAAPSCLDRFDALTRCQEASLSCSDTTVIEYSERLTTSKPAESSACATESEAFLVCLQSL
jgi:hypothetical protein